uniref:CENP-V/GFA domain-containing protein n=1 Tax=Hemiselmis andersenii TaxID=464988 RepID=A0A6U4ILH2_HEMAN|mmetsp:Transcript_7149/g.16370  ORF Transcript_7149/g.16370 Transcript_7149/m.16370 type:complete len:156 (-) Transcript_7149:91-558(-)
MEDLVEYRGGCHCQDVRFTLKAPRHLVCIDCTCSICAMRRNTHFVVPASRFHLEGASADKVSTYTYNTHVAQHKFCTRCGILSFYTPRSNPDGVAVTVWCLDKPLPVCTKDASGPRAMDTSPMGPDHRTFEVNVFDGDKWEENIEASGIRQLSKE